MPPGRIRRRLLGLRADGFSILRGVGDWGRMAETDDLRSSRFRVLFGRHWGAGARIHFHEMSVLVDLWEIPRRVASNLE